MALPITLSYFYPATLVSRLIKTEATRSCCEVNELQTGQRLLSLGLVSLADCDAQRPLVMWRRPDKAPQCKCGMQAVKGAAGQLPMEQVGRPLKATETLQRYYWSHLSIHPTPALVLILLRFGWIRPPLCTHAFSQRCAAGSQWDPTGLPPPLHPLLLPGAGTAPWIGHLSWRTWAASGCLCWALRERAGTDKPVNIGTMQSLQYLKRRAEMHLTETDWG